jgi:hypothetical protein
VSSLGFWVAGFWIPHLFWIAYIKHFDYPIKYIYIYIYICGGLEMKSSMEVVQKLRSRFCRESAGKSEPECWGNGKFKNLLRIWSSVVIGI